METLTKVVGKKTRRMALGTTIILMDPCIAASGTLIRNKEEELNTGLMDQSSMETTSKV